MPVKKKNALGRGLDALLPEEDLHGTPVEEIDLGSIDPNRSQPRQTFSAESISQLAQSIREQGVLQPLLVVADGAGRYRIVAGERRWRAAREAGLKTVPCLVRSLSAAQEMEIALVENLQREDLNPMETALGIRTLMDKCGYTQEQAAERLGKSRPAVANSLRLLTLPEEVAILVRSGALSAGHARVLAGLESPGEQLHLAEETVKRGWSVRQLEVVAASRKAAGGKKKTTHKPMPAELTDLEERIRETMGVRTQLTGSVRRGRIVLQYYSREELEHIYEVLSRIDGQ